jgi:rhamnulose-1-phosphate aldolase
MKATGGKQRVIYHCHPANLIALSFILPLEDEVFSRELWEMMTECPIIFPAGIGVVRWMVPGGREIAVETSEKMKRYDAVVWAHHGLFCSGTDFDSTFGLAHTIEKSAEIYIKVHSVVPNKRQTITKSDFIELAKAFGVTLQTDFLK